LDLRGLLGLAMGSSLVVQVSSLMAYACCTNLILLQSVYISISTFVAWSWWMRSSDVDCPTESGSSMGQQKFTLRYTLRSSVGQHQHLFLLCRFFLPANAVC
jgi:hypothetical protein